MLPASSGASPRLLSAASVPLFYLDFRRLPSEGVLVRWLAEPHFYRDVGGMWVDSGIHFKLV